MPTFDGPNLTIILDSAVTEVDVEADLYSGWKEWVLLSDNAKYPAAFRTVGGDSLTAGIDAGAYFFLQNQVGWRIKPPEEDITVFITGNLAVEEPTLPSVLPTDGEFTAAIFGLQPVTQSVDKLLTLQQESLYDGFVYIDTINGSPGVSYPVGTASEPVNNWEDAQVIAKSLGLIKYEVHGVVQLASSTTGTFFKGVGTPAIVDLNGQVITGSVFEKVLVYGDAAGSTDVLFEDSRVENVLNIQASFIRSVLSGVISLVPGSGNSGHFFGNCANYVTDSSNPIIDCQGNPVDLVFRGWKGCLELKNIDDANEVSVDLDSGELILGNTITAGVFTVRGIGVVSNASIGATIDTSALVNAPSGPMPHVRQSWTRAVTGGSKLRAIVSLDLDGNTINLPGTATLDIVVRDAYGNLEFEQTGIFPNAQGYFYIEQDPYTPMPGTLLASFATITNGIDVYASVTQLAVPEFA